MKDTEKQCTRCGEVKDKVADFHPKQPRSDRPSDDGFQAWCKLCQNGIKGKSAIRDANGDVDLVRTNLSRLQMRLLNILQRESLALSRRSKSAKLNKDDASALVNYTKLVRDLIKTENENEDKLTDEQLEAIAKGKHKDPG